MKNLLIITLIISASVSAEDCPSNQVISGQGIIDFAEAKCLTSEIGKEVIAEKLIKSKSTKKFCKTCNNHLLKMSLKAPEEIAKTQNLYADATMGELQKELAQITVDLMKMRSSFNTGIDSAQALKSCNFKNVEIPTCLRGKEKTQAFKEFESKKNAMKNIMATELANMLTKTPNMEEGLFKRTSVNSCHLKDNDIFFAKMRDEESLLTPEFIQQLKKINIKKDKSIFNSIEVALDSGVIKHENFRSTYSYLSQHPLFHAMLNSQEHFQSFLESLSNAETNETLIEKLYASDAAKNFGKSIADRCSESMIKTTAIMEKVYCETQKPFIADDSQTMGLLNQESFHSMRDEQLESNLQRHCALLNNQTENDKSEYTSFKEVLKINENNDPALFTLPLKQFKTDAYSKTIANTGEQICRAKIDKSICINNRDVQACRMLQYLEQTNKKTPYQDLAQSHDLKINEILRGFIGDGLPQTNGKVDQVAVKLLQVEGILPGEKTKQENSSVRDVGSFHKMVADTNNTRSNPVSVPPRFASPTSETPVSEINELPTQSASISPSNRMASVPNHGNSTFSHLSESEQKKVLSYLKDHKNLKMNSPKGFDDIQKFDSNVRFADAATPTNSESGPVHNLMGNFSNVPTSSSALGQTKLERANTNSEANKKEITENNMKAGPSNESRSDSPSLNISKTQEGLNEIKISVSEDELKKTFQFKGKLKELLATRRKDLSLIEQKDKIIIKLNEHEIVVKYNKILNQYEVSSKDQSIPQDYISTISHYFNYTMKEGPGKRETLINILKISHNLKTN